MEDEIMHTYGPELGDPTPVKIEPTTADLIAYMVMFVCLAACIYYVMNDKQDDQFNHLRLAALTDHIASESYRKFTILCTVGALLQQQPSTTACQPIDHINTTRRDKDDNHTVSWGPSSSSIT